MPSVVLNRKVVEQTIGKKMSTKELKHAISYLGTDLEEVTETEIHVEVFPNRPDLLSEQGLARALRAFTTTKTGLPTYKSNKSSYQVIKEESVKQVRPYTACAVVKGIQFSEERIREIIQMQEKLHITFGRNRKKLAIGVYPLEKITFPITYTGKHPKDITFQPLESSKQMTGLQVLSQHPTGRDYAHLLEGAKVFPFFIDANNQVLSMPPIINSDTIGKVEATTKDVFVECSGFDMLPLEQCLHMVVTALSEMGGKIYDVEILEGKKRTITPTLATSKRILNVENTNNLLGLSLSNDQVQANLKKMCYGTKKIDKNNIEVTIPCFRTDILHEWDLIEDVAIGYGYDNLEPTTPNIATVGQEADKDIVTRKISQILTGLGITEVNSFVIAPEHSQTTKVRIDKPVIKLKNPATTEYDCLRHWLVSSQLEVLQLNKSHEYPQHIFLTGRCVQKIKQAPHYQEDDRVAITLCDDKTTFTDIKQVLDYLFQQFDLSYTLKEIKHPTFIEGRAASIYCDKKEVGIIGEIHPQVLEHFTLCMPAASCEIIVDKLLPLLNR